VLRPARPPLTLVFPERSVRNGQDPEQDRRMTREREGGPGKTGAIRTLAQRRLLGNSRKQVDLSCQRGR
jgi:hypothetical protein